MSSPFLLRPATSADLETLCAFDQVACQDPHRRDFIRRTIGDGLCTVLETGGRTAGYGVLEYTFFEQGFVSMLYIHPDFRRQGAGAALLRHFESVCHTAKLFSSTNQSNLPMQALLGKLGYLPSGVIHNLDEGDPELVFVKYLQPAGKTEQPKKSG